jgi:hypothetical protein
VSENFIEVYNDALSKDQCQSIIDYFNSMKECNLVFQRHPIIEGPKHEKEDETVFLTHPQVLTLNKTHPILEKLSAVVFECYREYVAKYSVLQTSKNQGITSIRLQRTPIGGGYHKWHFENNGLSESSRIVAFTVYLNDMEDNGGGETEYLYQHCRCEAIAGRIAIWPAGFTHPHRGNPPLKNEKYIATGWIEYLD